MTDDEKKQKLREKRIKNLKPAKKGEVRNPKGKPKGTKDRSTIIKMYSDAVFRDKNGKTMSRPFGIKDKEPMTVLERVNLALLNRAMKGNVPAIKAILDLVHGPAPLKIIGDVENPLHIKQEQEFTGQALIDELKRRGLPTNPLEE